MAEKKPKVYVIGSLRNPQVLDVTLAIEKALPVEVFSDWLAAGPEADDKWKEYEQARGRTYEEALRGYAARNVFAFDKHHLDTSDAAVLVYPAGKSGHLELGYMAGRGKPTAILLDADYDRWDVMLNFADIVTRDIDTLVSGLKEHLNL
jgi:nucleoside 2-deoxyribosyltransferase